MLVIGYVVAVAATAAAVWMRVTCARDVRLAYAAGFSDGRRDASGGAEPEPGGDPAEGVGHGLQIPGVDVRLNQ